MLDMTVQDVFMNPFGAFFEVQVPFYTRAHQKRRERYALQLSGLFHLSGITALEPWSEVSG